MELSVYGIRHHGPGSARALVAALALSPPDAILIECPADVAALLPFMAQPDLIPPVAMLVYNPKDFRQASYLPYTAYSPEWVAIRWAILHGIPVGFMDLPMEIQFGLSKDDEKSLLATTLDPDLRHIQRDPLGYMAQLANYADRERWWEVTIEQAAHEAGIFGGIEEMMRTLRDEIGNERESRETLLREAFMRRTIRQYQKMGHQHVAVVCGAWHAPVLADYQKVKDSADAGALRGLKKVKTACTWIPWSYHRMTQNSGYGAGVTAPAWYELLHGGTTDAAARWLTQAAHLLREQRLPISTAHVIEAVRLSETLAAMRNVALAGLEELDEAMMTTMGGGNNLLVDTIRPQLLVGDRIGSVAPNIPTVPLQRDFEAAVRTVRLREAYETANLVTKELDLRKDTQLAASRLLHALNLLDIDWGIEQAGSERAQGTFKELWHLQWEPDFAILIIEASQWGNTVSEAATALAIDKAKHITQLPPLTQLLQKALKADLADAIPTLVAQLQHISAITTDTLHLMDALPPLVTVLRYGSTHRLDAEALRQVTEGLAQRVCIGLPSIAYNLEEDTARETLSVVLKAHQAIQLYGNQDIITQWMYALQAVAQQQNSDPLLAGGAVRILFDKGAWPIAETATRMRYVMSGIDEPMWSALWLEGFLQGSALVLVHHHSLWSVLDEWVAELNFEQLRTLLPVLRRSFSQFSGAERQKLLQLVAQGRETTKVNLIPEWDETRATHVMPILELIFG